MDFEWAAERLNEHIGLTTLTQTYYEDFGTVGELAATPEQLHSSAQIVEKIMDRVTPTWRQEIAEDPAQLWQPHRAAAVRALVEVEHAEELAEKLGDSAPTLNAAAMHPWVWEGARSLWQSGHYGEAVRAAITKVNAELQNKVGRRDISEEKLVKEAFSDNEPNERSPRLRPLGDDGGTTSLSLRRGIRSMGEVCFAALRNPASHDPIADVGEHVALEQLATVSLLARWIDEAEIVTA
ncbi:TIGR02391 family protein [Agromyces sp. NPDC056965]|uniref:TIGR02391 family protein n=1 Tax=Agromyces sp. NPDC056965 TaxID=3345983 RepID=UPI00363AE702